MGVDTDHLVSEIERDYPRLEALYRHLHANPELSRRERETSACMADEMRRAGLQVTQQVGGYGVVGVLENGSGPTVMVRTDMDALPIREETGLFYASRATAVDEGGRPCGVMHACGHDVHMTVQTGTLRFLSAHRDLWHGTVVAAAQPAEETLHGAEAMIAAGLFTRFPRPDGVLGLHVMNLPAGSVGVRSGYWFAGVTTLDVIVRGRGGHGAHPHQAKDPIILAAQIVLALQTIVSRELDPLEPAVVTVGSIHGGTRANIIPEEVRLEVNLRAFPDCVRGDMAQAVKRIAEGTARAAGMPEELLPEVALQYSSPALYNDPDLTRRVILALREVLGEKNVVEQPRFTATEDFALFGAVDPPIPLCFFGLGARDPAAPGKAAPLHSSRFAPLPEITITTGVRAMTGAVLALLADEGNG